MNVQGIKSLEDLNEAVRENKSIKDAVRLKCLDCSAYQYNEVRCCTITNCPLYPFRTGKNPFRGKKELTEEQRKEIVERLQGKNK